MAKKKDTAFLKELEAYAEELRRNIETECDGFSTDDGAIAERRAKALDVINGFAFFIETYFPHYIRSPHRSQLHEYLFTRLPEILASTESESDGIAAPRGESKSTLVTQLFSVYCIVTGQKHFIGISMNSLEQACPMLESIKAELEFNPRLATDFTEACGKGRVWKEGVILTNNGVKVQVSGTGKRLRGLRHGAYRPDLWILDDIENDENVASKQQRDKTSNWVKKTIMPLGGADDKFDVVWIGTILHHDSALNRVLTNPLWKCVRLKALLQWPDNMKLWDEWEEILRNQSKVFAAAFYEKNKLEMDAGAIVSWAARPLIKLMLIRVRDGHDTFDCEYQNDPTEGDSAIFAKSIFFWVNRLASWMFYGAVDPSLGEDSNKNDPSAILVGGYNYETGVLDVVEASIKRRLPDKIIEDVIMYHKMYRCLKWAIETVQFQQFLKTELVKRSRKNGGVAVPAVGVKPIANKILRIESLQPHMANGTILIHATQVTLEEQLRHFPKAAHDDGPDALEMLFSLVQNTAALIEFESAPTRGRLQKMYTNGLEYYELDFGDEENDDSRSAW